MAPVYSTGFGTHYIPGASDAIEQPEAPAWDFWWYGSAVIPGVTGAAPLFLFNGSKTKLYNDLSFTPPVVVPPTTPTDPTTPGDPPPSGETNVVGMDTVVAELARIRAAVEKIAGVLK